MEVVPATVGAGWEAVAPACGVPALGRVGRRGWAVETAGRFGSRGPAPLGVGGCDRSWEPPARNVSRLQGPRGRCGNFWGMLLVFWCESRRCQIEAAPRCWLVMPPLGEGPAATTVLSLLDRDGTWGLRSFSERRFPHSWGIPSSGSWRSSSPGSSSSQKRSSNSRGFSE